MYVIRNTFCVYDDIFDINDFSEVRQICVDETVIAVYCFTVSAQR